MFSATRAKPGPPRRGAGFIRDRPRRGAISNKVFVGNLSFDVTREELIEAFSAAGQVVDAKVPTDRETGRPRGFAFVQFEDEEAARRCIDLLNGQDLKGRALRVNPAEDRPPRPSAGPGFSRGSGPSRPSPRFDSAPPPDFPPPFAPEGEGHRGKRFRQKPARKSSPRRRRDQVDDDDDY